MANAGARGHNTEVFKCALPPFQEFVALNVLFIFALHVCSECLRIAEAVNNDRVVNDKINRNQRIDFLRVAFQQFHAVAHCRQIDYGGNACKVLHQHAGGTETHFGVSRALVGKPGHEAHDVFLCHRAVIFIAQQVFQKHFHRIGQRRHALQSVLFGGLQAVVSVGF